MVHIAYDWRLIQFLYTKDTDVLSLECLCRPRLWLISNYLLIDRCSRGALWHRAGPVFFLPDGTVQCDSLLCVWIMQCCGWCIGNIYGTVWLHLVDVAMYGQVQDCAAIKKRICVVVLLEIGGLTWITGNHCWPGCSLRRVRTCARWVNGVISM